MALLAGGPVDRVGVAVRFLESRLSEELDVNTAARSCGYSRFHFMRRFRAAVGFSVAEYVRRRRLTLAAQELAAGHSVLETALEFGYGSQSAFTRAFTRSFGVPPGAYARGLRADSSDR